jgi:uncharacterized protein
MTSSRSKTPASFDERAQLNASGPAGTITMTATNPAATSPVKPVPVPDERSAGYWAAAARHELAIARCPVCRRYSIPPDLVCRLCSNTDQPFVYETVSGRGTIRSWTVIRMALLPGFRDDVPYVLVDVELDEQPGLRMIGRLTDGPSATFTVGARAKVAFDDMTPGVSVPAFTLVVS